MNNTTSFIPKLLTTDKYFTNQSDLFKQQHTLEEQCLLDRDRFFAKKIRRHQRAESTGKKPLSDYDIIKTKEERIEENYNKVEQVDKYFQRKIVKEFNSESSIKNLNYQQIYNKCKTLNDDDLLDRTQFSFSKTMLSQKNRLSLKKNIKHFPNERGQLVKIDQQVEKNLIIPSIQNDNERNLRYKRFVEHERTKLREKRQNERNAQSLENRSLTENQKTIYNEKLNSTTLSKDVPRLNTDHGKLCMEQKKIDLEQLHTTIKNMSSKKKDKHIELQTKLNIVDSCSDLAKSVGLYKNRRNQGTFFQIIQQQRNLQLAADKIKQFRINPIKEK